MLIDLKEIYPDNIIDINNYLRTLDVGLYQRLHYDVRQQVFGRSNGFPGDWADDIMFWPEVKLPTAEERLKGLSNLFKTQEYFETYGSCDSPEQFLTTDTGKIIQKSDKKFVVVFNYLHQKEGGGRRWHKNGSHIGLLQPEYEYFKDEPHIKEIYEFEVIRYLK